MSDRQPTDAEFDRLRRDVASCRGAGPAPVDWPARFHAAADAAKADSDVAHALYLVAAAHLSAAPPHVVDAIGRALLTGETDPIETDAEAVQGEIDELRRQLAQARTRLAEHEHFRALGGPRPAITEQWERGTVPPPPSASDETAPPHERR